MINVFLGVLLMAIGVGVFWAQMFTTFASVYFLGWIILAAGVGQFFYGITSGNLRSTMFYVVTGIISTFIGLVSITNPALSAVTFTLLIAGLLIVSGCYRVIATLMTREHNWGWHLTGGITSLFLGVAIALAWPYSGLVLIGLFIGIELIINGALLTMQPAILYDEQRAYPTSPFFAGVKGGKSKKKSNNHIDKDYADRNYTKSRARKVD
jgi:uncharacterized membrane protein HdeD (DUF308 family)